MSKKGGKASRAKTKARRKRERRARKQSQQEQYQKWRDLGINQKSKRFSRKKHIGPKARKHPRMCGNPACIKCYGLNFKPFLVKDKPKEMPQWMFQRWLKAA
jgi:hypothetical protein